MIQSEIKDGRAYLSTPYSTEFIQRIKRCGGRWDAESRRWHVPEDALPVARTIMREIYGETDEAPAVETVTLEATFTRDAVGYGAPIELAGRVIARAWGRDSGARSGNEVAFVEGNPTSGGSTRNWTTIVPAGSVVLLFRVPIALAHKLLAAPPEDVNIRIIDDPKLNRAALIEEKAKLLARIAEINALLGEGE